MDRSRTRAGPALLAVFAAACSGNPGASPTAAPSPNPSPSPSAPPNANVAVVRIEQTGGMMPPWETMRWYPTVVLYGDGRLISQGAQVEMYPGPALPNLIVTRFSQHGIDQVLQWAAQAGLEGPDRQLGPMILDAGEMLFTVVSANGMHRTGVTDMSGNDLEIGALRQFQDVMTNLHSWLVDDIESDETAYPWDRLRVISFPSDAANLPDPNLASTVDWPLDPLATLGASWGEPATFRCFELKGDDWEPVRALFEQANELTLYRSDDTTYQLYLHPLLPDDEACPGF